MSAPAGRTALLLGATGLVGGHLLELLLEEAAYRRVVVLGRRLPEHRHPKLEAHVVDFDRLGEHAERFAAHDVFCSLGTTLRRAGSRAAFRRVDQEYPVAAARLAAERGATRYLLVSAAGADPRSRVFYSRVKGEAEAAVRAFPFASVVVLRPSLLLGERGEHRPAEALLQKLLPALAPLLVGPLRRYRAIHARTVARAMVRLAKDAPAGVRVIESDRIQEIGGA